MRCGKCKERHDTIADVKACYAVKVAPVVKHAPATEGMYLVNGVAYKVQRAIHGSGHLMAKRLTPDGFTFEPGAIARINQSHRMTAEQAAQYGKLYGRCIRCQADLTDEESIARGIGPICATKI